MRDFMFRPFFRAYSQWRTRDIGRIMLFLLLLLLLQICRGTSLLRLLLMLLLLLLLLRRLLLLTLQMVLMVTLLVAPALAFSLNGLYPSLVFRRPYGYNTHSPCP